MKVILCALCVLYSIPEGYHWIVYCVLGAYIGLYNQRDSMRYDWNKWLEKRASR
ncbi:hypothetical protein UFOVP855_25 [uncultured Caudovirales phage]|jgi:uncharacterized membrane protein|uniref:Uncharacterized protein n=1 Tax=uncultured Caudovirales phage TaxID=2100421 RepID=A0A6J5P8Y9_9CAUD|nr:hypothetical protein UFOVP527_2 [uncultured Caudovirales phage]CAB4167522.1 hypothetical protein UFOVP855_25 [uncultured Caudovirales phage]CAB4173608.1 hypothetical protein UFOVP954_49 [uncultured Caudovirales phage]CAB4178913.1 hypothetical protein UFOVP1026_12 [uncultured Caudovirales phage]CAB4188680.1 hypothetical protein UFOVP1180_49 [uncultured Caudovirales phage]